MAALLAAPVATLSVISIEATAVSNEFIIASLFSKMVVTESERPLDNND